METNSFAFVAAAVLASRDRLADDARGGSGERRMARLSATGLFQEALLGALRSHVAELRTVAR